MNRLKKFQDKNREKRVSKEVKKSMHSSYSSQEGDALLLKAVKSQYKPQKGRNLLSTQKAIALKKKKLTSKHSKRTTPGEIYETLEATPHFAQTEGARWNRVLTLQNKTQTKSLAKKITKQKPKEQRLYKKAS